MTDRLKELGSLTMVGDGADVVIGYLFLWRTKPWADFTAA